MENNEIWMIYGENFKENTIRLLEEANLKERIASEKSKIGIKF